MKKELQKTLTWDVGTESVLAPNNSFKTKKKAIIRNDNNTLLGIVGVLKDISGSIADCTESIKLDPYFPAAYMTRVMAKIQLKQLEEGCLDLSKAGELGMTDAYEEIKRTCNK
jgi:hypothetical protein